MLRAHHASNNCAQAYHRGAKSRAAARNLKFITAEVSLDELRRLAREHELEMALIKARCPAPPFSLLCPLSLWA